MNGLMLLLVILSGPADASVSVSVARVHAAQSNRPALPNDVSSQAPVPLVAEKPYVPTKQDFDKALEAIDLLIQQNKDLGNQVEALHLQIQKLEDKSAEPQASQVQPPKVPQDPVAAPAISPMRIEVASNEVAPVQSKAPYKCWYFTGEKKWGKGWCKPCPVRHAVVGHGNKDLEIEWSEDVAPGAQVYPACRWKNSKGDWVQPEDRAGNYQDPGTIEEILSWMRGNNAPVTGGTPVAATGRGGAIHAKQQIQDVISWFDGHITGSLVFTWDSNRLGKFALLNAKSSDWIADRIYGSYGSFRVTCEGGIKLGGEVFHELEVNYRSDGDSFKITTVFAISKSAVEPGNHAVQSAVPIKVVDPLTLMTVAQVLKAIWDLCHPTVDLELPGRIQATVAVKDGALDIKCSESPRIRISALWQWLLGVDHISASPDLVTIDFANQPGVLFPIKQRTFVVQ